MKSVKAYNQTLDYVIENLENMAAVRPENEENLLDIFSNQA